ncbi:hypothetical protein Tco_0115357, partial [Tanacetum coccineum]
NTKGTFTSIVKEGTQKQLPTGHSKPALVLDDSCTKDHEFSMSLMGKVKEVSTIPNLYIILLKEGFSSVNLTYLGGLWVLIELDSLASKENSHNHVGVGYWSKVYWIRDKELDAWTLKFLVDNLDNSSSDDESIDADEGRKYGDKEHENIKENSEVNRVSESSCMHGNEFMHENVANIHCKETIQSKDPFNIYEILRKNKDNVSRSKYVDPSYPPDSPSQRSASMAIIRGSILEVMDDLVKVGQTMGYNMEGCLGHKAKKGWIKELYLKHRINFVALQETKMEITDLFSIKVSWGNLTFDHVVSSSVGNSRGVFNEVRTEQERFGSMFNIQGAMASLIELPLGGLMTLFPYVTGLCPDRHLSGHCPILIRESFLDYGPTPFCMFHSWFNMEGYEMQYLRDGQIGQTRHGKELSVQVRENLSKANVNSGQP